MNVSMRMQFLLLLTSSLLVVTSCKEEPKEPIRIASSPWPGYEPLYLSRDLGYLSEDKVLLYELPSQDITMESFRNHSTDMATLTLDEVLELLHDGFKLRIIQVLDVSNGGDAVLARPDIKDITDIKGKNISIVNIPLGLYMLSRMLDKAGLSRDDVQVFPVSEPKQVEYVKKENMDVVITFEPMKTLLKGEGMHVIFDSSMIPNEVIDLLIVHEDVYLQRRDEVCEITKQWNNVLDYMKKNKEEAARRITGRLGVDVSEYDNMMKGLLFGTTETNMLMLGGERPKILDAGEILMNIMVRERHLTKRIDISQALDPNFLPCLK